MFLFETRNYGFNEIIKQYARFPWYLSLPAHFEHGWSPAILDTDLSTKKPLMLVFSKRKASDWQKVSEIPVAVIGSPFRLFRKLNHIRQKENARGTVVFPAHSTYGIKNHFEVDKYCKELKQLPEKFQPITICLFWHDFVDKSSDIYRQNGFRVVSAGRKFTIGLNFVRNFYEILSSHKYSSSNEIGSHTFYAVDFGLPFFLLGRRPSARRVKKGHKLYPMANFKFGRLAEKLFDTGPVIRISPEQKAFVNQETGASDCLTRDELAAILKENNKTYLSLAKTLHFHFESLALRFVFNGPWGRAAIAIRKKMIKG